MDFLTETDKESDMTDKQLEQEAENRFPLYKYPLQHIAFKEGIAFALSNVVGQSEQFYCANKGWCGIAKGRYCYKEKCEDWSEKQ